MSKTSTKPDYVFEVSWEVCNKVGGIYTVLSSVAKTLKSTFDDRLCFIGPDLNKENNPYFIEDKHLLPEWKDVAARNGMSVRIGRWNVPGNPVAVLIDFSTHYHLKNEIYTWAWQRFGVDSIRGYGDYDEASMFSYAAGRFVEFLCKEIIKNDKRVVYQAHEWMSGLGMLFLKYNCPEVATVFTTHATSIGRSITSNNKNLYEYFEAYDGDQMAWELNMEAKHSIEKQSALGADCFTTVSHLTAKECKQFLTREPDMVLPNGFESDFVPKAAGYTAKRKAARKQILRVASLIMGETLPEDTLIVSTSGRNDFRCKGYDVFIDAVAQLKQRLSGTGRHVLALMEVPCWVFRPRVDLLGKLSDSSVNVDEPMDWPMITHDLNNLNEERIVRMIREKGLNNEPGCEVKILLIPSYLEGSDGVFNKTYYDLLPANDLCVYPSYYEPWGYTPLESCAFRIPCITTDLAGFGLWVNEFLNKDAKLEDGVCVLHRDDNNYDEVVTNIDDVIIEFMNLTDKQKTDLKRKAATIAQHASWADFGKYYLEAFSFALSK